MLRVRNINFFYGEVQVLKDVSLDVERGSLVAIFGPNGHGKSTLLKVICGMLRPDSGTVELDGQRIDHLPVEQIVNMGLVYIAEDRHLFPDMSVLDNLRMGAYCKRGRAAEKENLEYVLRLFPKLQKLERRLASDLSGGEARMLAIARGLMENPRIVAVDEPSFGLAPILRADVFKAIGEIRRRSVTVLLVEQSTGLALEYADRVCFLEDGRIVFEGPPEEAVKAEKLKTIFIGM